MGVKWVWHFIEAVVTCVTDTLSYKFHAYELGARDCDLFHFRLTQCVQIFVLLLVWRLKYEYEYWHSIESNGYAYLTRLVVVHVFFLVMVKTYPKIDHVKRELPKVNPLHITNIYSHPEQIVEISIVWFVYLTLEWTLVHFECKQQKSDKR